MSGFALGRNQVQIPASVADDAKLHWHVPIILLAGGIGGSDNGHAAHQPYRVQLIAVGDNATHEADCGIILGSKGR